ncbi:hypothetical protein HDU93_006497, partial [Gonapodya sp. JEL0774]
MAPLSPPSSSSTDGKVPVENEPTVVFLAVYSYGRGDPTTNSMAACDGDVHPVVSLVQHLFPCSSFAVAVLHPRGLPLSVPPTSPVLSSPHYPCDVALAAGSARRRFREATIVVVGIGREGAGMSARYASATGGNDGLALNIFVGVSYVGEWPSGEGGTEKSRWLKDIKDIVTRSPAVFYNTSLDIDPDAVLRKGANVRDVETALLAPAYGFTTLGQYREVVGSWVAVGSV